MHWIAFVGLHCEFCLILFWFLMKQFFFFKPLSAQTQTWLVVNQTRVHVPVNRKKINKAIFIVRRAPGGK